MEKKLDLFLESLCMSGGKTTEKYVKGYSEEAESALLTLGYIKIEGNGIWKEIEITEEGRRFYREGGFACKRKKEQEAIYDRMLDNRSKIINNRVIVATLIVSLLSLAATIYFGLRNG